MLGRDKNWNCIFQWHLLCLAVWASMWCFPYTKCTWLRLSHSFYSLFIEIPSQPATRIGNTAWIEVLSMCQSLTWQGLANILILRPSPRQTCRNLDDTWNERLTEILFSLALPNYRWVSWGGRTVPLLLSYPAPSTAPQQSCGCGLT